MEIHTDHFQGLRSGQPRFSACGMDPRHQERLQAGMEAGDNYAGERFGVHTLAVFDEAWE